MKKTANEENSIQTRQRRTAKNEYTEKNIVKRTNPRRCLEKSYRTATSGYLTSDEKWNYSLYWSSQKRNLFSLLKDRSGEFHQGSPLLQCVNWGAAYPFFPSSTAPILADQIFKNIQTHTSRPKDEEPHAIFRASTISESGSDPVHAFWYDGDSAVGVLRSRGSPNFVPLAYGRQ